MMSRPKVVSVLYVSTRKTVDGLTTNLDVDGRVGVVCECQQCHSWFEHNPWRSSGGW